MAVPLFDTSTALWALREELRAAVARVLDSERYILGPEVSAFEQEFAAYCGCEHAIGVANGTEAITIALRAMGVGPGDEVVVPSFTFYASAEAIPPTGATPVFCDIDPDTYCVTADTVRAALTPRTKAVIAVHLFGNVAPVAEIEALGVPVLEDAAQAAGSTLDRGPPGRARHGRHVLVFSLQEPRLLRRRRHDHDLRRVGRRAGAHAAFSRLPRQGRLRADRLQLPPGRAAGGDPARAAPAPRRVGRRAPRAPGTTTSRAGLGELVTLPRPSTAPRPPGICMSSATPTWSVWRARSARRGSAAQGLLPHARAPPAGDARMERRGGAARHR